MTTATNRSVTLVGQNKLFSAIGVEFFHHELNYYWCDFRGTRWERPTLTQLCQDLLKHIYEGCPLASEGEKSPHLLMPVKIKGIENLSPEEEERLVGKLDEFLGLAVFEAIKTSDLTNHPTIRWHVQNWDVRKNG